MKFMAAMLLLSSSACAPAQQVASAPYKGWSEALTMRSSDGAVSMTAVPEIAGRIIRYTLGGENILFENPDYLGKTLANTSPERLAQGYIGYQVDLGPELRRIPRHLALWMGPAAAEIHGKTLTLTSVDDPAVGMRLHKDITFDPYSSSLEITQTMTNVSGKEQAYCLWDRTLCVGGGFAIAKLNTTSRFKSGWTLMKNGAYVGDSPEHPNVTVKDGILVAEAKGTSTKIGMDADSGWVGYARGRLLFVKRFLVTPGGAYTDGGHTLEIYFDPKVCELEPLSPEVTLRPGEDYSFSERWTLRMLDREVRTAEEARALVDEVAGLR